MSALLFRVHVERYLTRFEVVSLFEHDGKCFKHHVQATADKLHDVMLKPQEM